MSIRLMDRAWSMPIPTSQKMVLLALADRANDDGECWPGQTELASKCSMSNRNVIRMIDWLEARGALRSERRQTGNARRSNRYTLTLDQFNPESDNLSHANLAHDNLACDTVSPPNVTTATFESDTVSHSYKEEPSKNHQKEPSLHTPRAKALGAADLVRLGVDEQVATDFMAVRRAKRLPLTQTALDDIVAQAGQARLLLADAIRVCVIRGWGGFRADWLLRDSGPTGHQPQGIAERRANTIAELTGQNRGNQHARTVDAEYRHV